MMVLLRPIIIIISIIFSFICGVEMRSIATSETKCPLSVEPIGRLHSVEKRESRRGVVGGDGGHF